ncbi:hypothetical protein VSS86_20715, partial [Bacillus safensis]|nr:hypothetical protein [Bacillus safensis]
MNRPLEEGEMSGTDGYTQITWTEDAKYKDKWLAWSSVAAMDLFESDETNYLNTVTCYVSEDGKLRIGVKVDGSVINWN